MRFWFLESKPNALAPAAFLDVNDVGYASWSCSLPHVLCQLLTTLLACSRGSLSSLRTMSRARASDSSGEGGENTRLTNSELLALSVDQV